MANQDLVNYINEASKHGDSGGTIKSSLLAAGWKDSDIEEAFSQPPAAAPKKHSLKIVLTIIFIVVLAMGALIGGFGLKYMGLFSPTKTLSEECRLSPDMSCNQFDVTSTSVSLVLGNLVPTDITLNKIKVGTCEKEFNTPMLAGGVGAFTLIGCNNGQPGSMFLGDITILYSGGALPREVSGNIIVKVKG